MLYRVAVISEAKKLRIQELGVGKVRKLGCIENIICHVVVVALVHLKCTKEKSPFPQLFKKSSLHHKGATWPPLDSLPA